MKARGPFQLLASLKTGLFLACFLLQGGPLAEAQQGYNVGSIVTTNFSLINRYRWTNDNGQVFTPSNTVIRLSDFDGKIVFFVFFDVW